MHEEGEAEVIWLVEVLERNGIVPAERIAAEICEAFPRHLAAELLSESASAVLHMRGVRDDAGDFARELGRNGAGNLQLALQTGIEDVVDTTDIKGPRVADEGRPCR